MKSVILNFFAELFFPSFCLGCGKEGVFLCYDCRSTLEISEYRYCLCDKKPLRIPFGETSGKCPTCRDKKLSGLYSALPYKEKWLTRKLICQFKYPPHIKNLAEDLAGIIAEHLILAGGNAEIVWQNSVLTPVPIDMKKIKVRGYNQTEELANRLAKITQAPVISNNLVKIKATQPQTELSAKERAENVKNVFSVKDPAEFKGKKVFLIDDVYTTGSTMEECASVLRKAKAKEVWGIAIAREG